MWKVQLDLSTTGDHHGIRFQADVLAGSSFPGPSSRPSCLQASCPPVLGGRLKVGQLGAHAPVPGPSWTGSRPSARVTTEAASGNSPGPSEVPMGLRPWSWGAEEREGQQSHGTRPTLGRWSELTPGHRRQVPGLRRRPLEPLSSHVLARLGLGSPEGLCHPKHVPAPDVLDRRPNEW